MVFPVVMYGCESWTVKKAERWRTDAFELWCWRRLLRFPWTARRSNQSILKEISPGCSWVERAHRTGSRVKGGMGLAPEALRIAHEFSRRPCSGDLGSIPGREDLLEKGRAIQSSVLAWRIPWTEEPDRLRFTEWQRVRHDWVTLTSREIFQQDMPRGPWADPLLKSQGREYIPLVPFKGHLGFLPFLLPPHSHWAPPCEGKRVPPSASGTTGRARWLLNTWTFHLLCQGGGLWCRGADLPSSSVLCLKTCLYSSQMAGHIPLSGRLGLRPIFSHLWLSTQFCSLPVLFFSSWTRVEIG